MNTLYFDIETIPSQQPGIIDEFRAAVTAPAQYKKADSIADWLAQNRDAEAEEAWLKTSFDGGLGHVVCIGYAIDDQPAECLSVDGELIGDANAEADLLREFFDVLTYEAGTKLRFVGHNLIGFDLPFLWKRAMVLGVKPPWTFPRNPKPWSELVDDTMLMWDSTQRAGGSMDRLCRLFGIPGKAGMDGSKVWPAVRDGRIADVVAYCKGDVERTRQLHKRMTFAQEQAA